MNKRGWKRVALVVSVCAVAGALAGIAGSMAATTTKPAPRGADAAKLKAWAAAHRFGRLRGFKRAFRTGLVPGGPPVHSETVLPNAAGTGFDTVTFDAGSLKAIDGSKLTLTEGTPKATYGTPTIDVGSSPKVIRNHEKASLGDLQTGDDVRIIQSPKGTVVMAEDAAFEKQERQNGPRWAGPPDGFGPGGGPPPGGPPPGGPPPGAPGAYPGAEQGSSSSGGSNN